METFPPLVDLWAGNSPVTGEFPSQRPVTRRFVVFFNLRLNKRLRKQSWGWWFETPSRSLWRHCNGRYCCLLDIFNKIYVYMIMYVFYWFVSLDCLFLHLNQIQSPSIDVDLTFSGKQVKYIYIYMLTHYDLTTPYDVSYIYVNIDSCNGLSLFDVKPLPEPIES